MGDSTTHPILSMLLDTNYVWTACDELHVQSEQAC